MLGIQTLRYLSRVSVLALKISRYIVFFTNWTFYLHELFETRICIYYPAVFLCFFFHPIPLCGSLFVILCSLIPAVPLVGGVSIFFLNRPISWKLIEIQIFDKKSCFRLSILYYKLNQVGYLTNTFHFAVGLFSYRPQMSNCGKKKKVALKLQPSVSECFKTVTRNPIVLYYKEVKCCSWWCNLCLCPQIDWK